MMRRHPAFLAGQGGETMTIRDSFAPEDWARILGAPMLAGIAVTAADPGGLWGAVRESVAVAGAVRDARAGGNPLVAEVVAAYETAEGRDLARGVLKDRARGKTPAAVVDTAVDELAAVAALVAAKAPEAAPGFRDWLKAIAARVAEAGTEGGFLGFGGEKVSAAEKATLERLATAIG
jgi:hypothetical protein